MPRLSKQPATPTPAADFTAAGMAVALADLAAQLSMAVADTAGCKDRVTGAGLPFPVPHHIAAAAHRIDRDRIDGMLWRCHGRKVSEPVPQVTRQAATKQIESVNTARATGQVVAEAPEAETLV